MTDSNGARYVRTSKAAAILHCSAQTVNRWSLRGRLPFIRTLGGQRLYPEAEIRALAASLREEVRDEPEEATA
jgi:excisionase family DNA binding protein